MNHSVIQVIQLTDPLLNVWLHYTLYLVCPIRLCVRSKVHTVLAVQEAIFWHVLRRRSCARGPALCCHTSNNSNICKLRLRNTADLICIKLRITWRLSMHRTQSEHLGHFRKQIKIRKHGNIWPSCYDWHRTMPVTLCYLYGPVPFKCQGTRKRYRTVPDQMSLITDDQNNPTQYSTGAGKFKVQM